MNKQKFDNVAKSAQLIGAIVIGSGLGYLGNTSINNYYNQKPEQKNTDIQQKIEDTVSNGYGFRKTMPREYLMNPQKSSPSKSTEELRLYLAEKEMEIEKKETGKVSDLLKKEYNLQLQRVANEEIVNKYFDNLLINNGFKADEVLDKEMRSSYKINDKNIVGDKIMNSFLDERFFTAEEMEKMMACSDRRTVYLENPNKKEHKEFTRFLEFNRVGKNKKSDLNFFKDECEVIIKDTLKTIYSNDAQNAYSKKDKN